MARATGAAARADAGGKSGAAARRGAAAGGGASSSGGSAPSAAAGASAPSPTSSTSGSTAQAGRTLAHTDPNATTFDLESMGASAPSAVQHGFSSMLFRGPQPRPGSSGGSSTRRTSGNAGAAAGLLAGVTPTISTMFIGPQPRPGNIGDAAGKGPANSGAAAPASTTSAAADESDGSEDEQEDSRGAADSSTAAAATGTARANGSAAPKGNGKRVPARKGKAAANGSGGRRDTELTEENASMSAALGGSRSGGASGSGNAQGGTAGGSGGAAEDENADPDEIRKAQNRIAQREFRQRKQEYIRALECRVELLSTDHDTQVDRLRWLLRQLLIENNQLRAVLGLLSSFVGDKGMGGFLGSNQDVKKELEELLFTTSERTVTAAWRSWPGNKPSETLRQMRLDAQLPPEGLPESADRVQYRATTAPRAASPAEPPARGAAASSSRAGKRKATGSAAAAGAGAGASASGSGEQGGEGSSAAAGESEQKRAEADANAAKRPRYITDAADRGPWPVPIREPVGGNAGGSVASPASSSAGPSSATAMSAPPLPLPGQASLSGGGAGAGIDPLSGSAADSAAAFMDLMRDMSAADGWRHHQMQVQRSFNALSGSPFMAPPDEGQGAAAHAMQPSGSGQANGNGAGSSSASAGANPPLPPAGLNGAYSGAPDAMGLLRSVSAGAGSAAGNGGLGRESVDALIGNANEGNDGVMAALYSQPGSEPPGSAGANSLGDLPLSAALGGNIGFWQDQNTITNGFAAAAFQALGRSAAYPQASRGPPAPGGLARDTSGNAIGASPSGGSGGAAPSPISAGVMGHASPFSGLPGLPGSMASPARAANGSPVPASAQPQAGSRASSEQSRATGSPTIAAGAPSTSSAAPKRGSGRKSTASEGAKGSAPGAAANKCPPDCASASAVLRRIKMILARINNARKRFGRTDLIDIWFSKDCPHAQLTQADQERLAQLDAAGKDFPSGPILSVADMQRMTEVELVNQHHLESFRRNPSYRLPAMLRPSEKQLTIPHDPLVDCFPFPGLRDALITHQDEIDLDELCFHLWQQMIVHAGDVMQESTWEIATPFLIRYHNLIDDRTLAVCNKHRTSRGEQPLSRTDLVRLGRSG